MDNIFFDTSLLKKCGKNVIIGKTVRIRYPELVEISDNVIIDDFCYISTSLKISSFVHISSGCKIIGGKESSAFFGKYSTLSPNVVIAAGSDDYYGGIATPLVPEKYKGRVERGNVVINEHCVIGSNSTLLPNVKLGIGSVLGAQSLLNKNTEDWSVYAGSPAKKIAERDKDKILSLQRSFEEEII
tara:strand:+ start:12351 stop:12908 length:558 start_codon:yes stop_codon:yes gene_type:complete